MATNAAAQNAIKKKLVQRLEVRLGIWAGSGRIKMHGYSGRGARDGWVMDGWLP